VVDGTPLGTASSTQRRRMPARSLKCRPFQSLATPKNHRVVRINIPDEVAIEIVAIGLINDWDAEDMVASRAFGDQWIQENRTAVLKVPSVITRGHENNLVLNTSHPQFSLINAEAPEQVYWDVRLFRPAK
jgi:RES domain-containing protein